MKKWFALFASLALGFSFIACDFGDNEGTGDDATEGTDEGGEEPELEPEDVPLTGECTEGQSGGIVLVRIDDDPDNATLKDCNTNPGADIDSVCILGPDDVVKACAEEVEVDDESGNVCDQNDKDDATEVTGDPDACVKDLGPGCTEDYANPDCECTDSGNYKGYYSLNGGAIEVTFEGGAEVLCMDQIWVVEMYNPDLAGSEENYSISYYNEDGSKIDLGDWDKLSDHTSGEATVEVIWDF